MLSATPILALIFAKSVLIFVKINVDICKMVADV